MVTSHWSSLRQAQDDSEYIEGSLVTGYFRQSRSGFTLIEILLVMVITAIIISFTTINLIKPQISSSLESTVTTLIADIKEQQLKSMVGDSENSGSPHAFGIYFETDRYILYRAPYNPSEPSNFTVNFEQGLSVTPIGSQFTFTRRSGETSPNSITLKHNQSGEQKTILINNLGAITIN